VLAQLDETAAKMLHRFSCGLRYDTSMQVTRRKLSKILTAGAAAAAAVKPAPQTAPPAENQDLRAAREELRANALRIALVKLPMSTEPAFQFKP
jgi:hypothetical protein